MKHLILATGLSLIAWGCSGPRTEATPLAPSPVHDLLEPSRAAAWAPAPTDQRRITDAVNAGDPTALLLRARLTIKTRRHAGLAAARSDFNRVLELAPTNPGLVQAAQTGIAFCDQHLATLD